MYFFFGVIIYDLLVFEIDVFFVFKVVFLDSMIINIDWIVKNINLFIWNWELWLIDYGVSFYFYYNWKNWEFYLFWFFFNIKDYVFLLRVSELEKVVVEVKICLNEGVIREIIDSIFEDWLMEEGSVLFFEEKRVVYIIFFMIKLFCIELFVKEVVDVR